MNFPFILDNFLDHDGSEGSHLTGLCQTHAHPEAGGHARRQGGGQPAAQAWLDHPDTSDHRLHYELTGELFDAGCLLTHLPVGHTINN